jgi:SAM-dependent methyltransferase
MSEVTKAIAELQQKKTIHVARYRKSERTGLDVPVYSLSVARTRRLDVHGLLAGVTSERLVEYDFVVRNLLRRSKANVLDVGAAGSGLAQAIRDFRSEWKITGIDLAAGSDAVMDALSTGFRDRVFDQVISVSTIEHLAIEDKSGDVKAMKEVFRILKKGGSAIITVPYGRRNRLEHRVYDRKSLTALAGRFIIVKKEFYRYDSGKWEKCSQAAADRAESQVPLQFHSAACACLLLKKQ